jgi:hypothetical protein
MLPDRPKPRPDLVIEVLGEEIMIYDTANDQVHVLNETARLIWDALDGQRSLADLVSMVMEHFDVPPERDLDADITRMLQDLWHKQLLQRAGDKR